MPLVRTTSGVRLLPEVPVPTPLPKCIFCEEPMYRHRIVAGPFGWERVCHDSVSCAARQQAKLHELEEVCRRLSGRGT